MSFQAWTIERGKALLLGTYPLAGDCDRVLRNGFDGGAVVRDGEIVRARRGTSDAAVKVIASAARERHRLNPVPLPPPAEAPARVVELPAVVEQVTPEAPAAIVEPAAPALAEIDLGDAIAAEKPATPPTPPAEQPLPRARVARPVVVHHNVRFHLAPETPAQAIVREINRTLRALTAHFGGGL